MKRLAFLASGGGSNVQAIVDACRVGQLDAEPIVVISNNADAIVLEKARQQGIAAFHMSQKSCGGITELDHKMVHTFNQMNIDWIILAGYMKKIGATLLKEYHGRIFNIHPSLLPKFGGQGMYGIHVHKAVLAAGEKQTGVTIHQVTDEYDKGRILAQSMVSVVDGDTAESLAARVLLQEHQLYPETLQKLIKLKI